MFSARGPLIFQGNASAGDTYWNNVQLLMDFDSNRNDLRTRTTVTDNSTSFETTVKKFGTASLLCNAGLGGSSGLGFSNSNMDPGTGDFCLEVHHYSPGAASNYYTGYSFNNTTTADYFGMLCLGSASYWNAHFFDGATMFANTTNLNLNQWYHIAIIRESSNMYIAVDGVREFLGTNSDDITLSSPNLGLPSGYGGDAGLGYWDNLRLTVGNARYTANFTAPTAAYPNF
jgi:hypothetical protein